MVSAVDPVKNTVFVPGVNEAPAASRILPVNVILLPAVNVPLNMLKLSLIVGLTLLKVSVLPDLLTIIADKFSGTASLA